MCQRAAIHVLQLSAHRHPVGNPARLDPMARSQLGDHVSCSVPFDGGVGRQDDFADGAAGQQALELAESELVGTDPIERRKMPHQHEVHPAVAARLLHRDDVRGEAFNAGGGRAYKVREVVAMVAELAGTGVEPEIRGTGNPEGEIDRQYVDPTKLAEVVGWRPQVELREGLARTIEWYREHTSDGALVPPPR